MGTSIRKRGQVPDDLIESILAPLPVKSLLRFKSISKSWRSLISSPSFVNMHSQRAPLRTHILTSSPSGLGLLALGHQYESSSSSSCFGDQVHLLRFPPKPEGDSDASSTVVRILGSSSSSHCHCHGLVALSIGNHSDFFISNPLTGDYKKLPRPSTSLLRPSSTKDEPLTGFGYDPSTDDYKLFIGKSWQQDRTCNYNGISRFKSVGEIFSVRSNSWRSIALPYDCMGNLSGGLFPSVSGCFVNGALHWIGRDIIEDILALDLKREEWYMVPPPEEVAWRPYKLGYWCKVGVLDGRLCLSYSRPSYDFLAKVWVRKNNDWTKLFTFRQGIMENLRHRPLPLSILRGRGGNGNQLITLNDKNELARYELMHVDDDDAKQQTILMYSEKFKLFCNFECECECECDTFKYERDFGNGTQAVMYSETLYFPLAMFGSNEEERRRKRQKQRD